MNYTVDLTPMEVEFAEHLGESRRRVSIEMDLGDETRFADNEKQPPIIEIRGAAGEMAYCKMLSIYFVPTINTFKDPDVGNITQIRTTHRERGSLIIRKKDPPDQLYVLMIGDMPTFRFVGYILGSEGMRSQWWGTRGTDRPPCWWVPQEMLKQTLTWEDNKKLLAASGYPVAQQPSPEGPMHGTVPGQ
jgi:hypothetical protein